MAGRMKAALGSLAFLVAAPGVVAGLMPWLVTQWRPLPPADGPDAIRWTGLILIAAGLIVIFEAFVRFAWVGLGTPAPVAPTRTLVVSGFYRFVRNPMYIAVTALIFGQAIVFGSWGVALYGVAVVAAFHAFVTLYEEPTLRATYEEEYDAYCARTPRWIRRRKLVEQGIGRWGRFDDQAARRRAAATAAPAGERLDGRFRGTLTRDLGPCSRKP